MFRSCLQPWGCCAELGFCLPEAAIPSRVCLLQRFRSHLPWISGYVSLLKSQSALVRLWTKRIICRSEPLSAPPPPPTTLCFLFVSGSWGFLLFCSQLCVFVMFYVIFWMWSYGLVVVARFMLVQSSPPPRFLGWNCVRVKKETILEFSLWQRGLRIWHCHCSGPGHCCGTGTFTCHRHGQK